MKNMLKSERQRIINHLKQLDQNEFDRFLDDVREARGVEAACVEALRRMFAVAGRGRGRRWPGYSAAKSKE